MLKSIKEWFFGPEEIKIQETPVVLTPEVKKEAEKYRAQQRPQYSSRPSTPVERRQDDTADNIMGAMLVMDIVQSSQESYSRPSTSTRSSSSSHDSYDYSSSSRSSDYSSSSSDSSSSSSSGD